MNTLRSVGEPVYPKEKSGGNLSEQTTVAQKGIVQLENSLYG